MKLQIEINFSDEEVTNVMVTAIEGGINYWCGKTKIMKDTLPTELFEDGKKVHVSDVISLGGSLKLYDAEDEDESWILTPDKMKKGLEKYFNELSADNEDHEISFDTCDIDADGADMIIQYALFGELIYG